MARARKLRPKPRPRPRKKREPIRPALAVGAAIAVLAWLLSWWAVPLAAAVGGVVWWRHARVGELAMWGAVAAWIVLLLVDSLHGRTIALARALGGAVFLPWPLLVLVTLLFAGALAWSAAVVSATITARVADR